MKKNKILLVATRPEMFLYILKNQPNFLNEYFNIELVTSPGTLVNKIKSIEKVKVHTIEIKRKISLFSDIKSLILLIFLFYREKPDIVHSFSPKAGLLSMIASKLCFIKHRLHTFTGLIFPSRKGIYKKLLILTDTVTCMCASEVIAESKGVAIELYENKVSSSLPRIIGHGNIAGVDTNYFKPVTHNQKIENRKKLNIPLNVWVFCFIGRLNKEKGIHELIEAFKSFPYECYLVIAGEFEDDTFLKNKIIKEIETNKKIISTGWIDDVRSVLSVADVNILPSYREGFPNVLLQSASMKIPSIATDVNGAREVIINNETGWLIPIKDKKCLLEAMIESYTVKDKTEELGSQSRILVKNKYDSAFYRLQLLEFYNSLSNKIKE